MSQTKKDPQSITEYTVQYSENINFNELNAIDRHHRDKTKKGRLEVYHDFDRIYTQWNAIPYTDEEAIDFFHESGRFNKRQNHIRFSHNIMG